MCVGLLWLGLILSHPALTAAQTLIYPLEHAPAVSATFGTYRIGHHHAGLDLVTGDDDTVAVLAAAEGRVIRVRRGHAGFGRAVYLSHPGGRVTVYAHLSAFGPSLAPLVTTAEAKSKGFSFDYRPRRRVTVKRGETLGWVGTSGTDLVHLHFEVRVDGAPVNPLRNGLTLPDTRPPQIRALLAIPYGPRAHVEDAHDERFLSLGAGTDPPPASSEPTLAIGGRVGLFVEAVDFIDGLDRAVTPYGVTLRVDGARWHAVRYDTSTYVGRGQTELDYHPRLRSLGKGMYHRLFGEGVRLRSHRKIGRTLERLRRGVHQAEIEVVDAVGLRTTQRFILEVGPAEPPCVPARSRERAPRTSTPAEAPLLRRDTLVVPLAELCQPGAALAVRVNGRRHRGAVVTRLAGAPAVALKVPVDADATVGLGLTVAGETRWTLTKTYATPEGKPRHIGPARIEVDKGARFFPYPTLHWTEENPGTAGLSVVGPIHRFANAYAPAKGGMAVALLRPRAAESKGLGLYLEEAGRWWYTGSRTDGGYVSGRTVHPVGLALMRDLTPPTIGAARVGAHPAGYRLFVPVHDAGSGLRAVEMVIDGAVVRAEHQRAWKQLVYTPRRPLGPGPHRVEIYARDRAGLETRDEMTIEWPKPK